MIQPKAEDTSWVVVPNLWGGIIAPPGLMKSPVISTLTRPLTQIEARLRAEYESATAEYESATNDYEQQREEAKLRHDAWREQYKAAQKSKAAPMRPDDSFRAPVCGRLITQDATSEKLHENHERQPRRRLSYPRRAVRMASDARQAVWEGHVNEPKTRRSKAPVPVIPALARMLNAYREQCGSPALGPMFRSEAGTPLNLNNVLNRMILPALNVCEVCRKQRTDHPGADHEYKRDGSRPEWHGWHVFRRGLATNLYRLGVNDKTIQAILRHSNVTTTMDIYVKTVSADSTAAMKLLETALCANCAPTTTPGAVPVLN